MMGPRADVPNFTCLGRHSAGSKHVQWTPSCGTSLAAGWRNTLTHPEVFFSICAVKEAGISPKFSPQPTFRIATWVPEAHSINTGIQVRGPLPLEPPWDWPCAAAALGLAMWTRDWSLDLEAKGLRMMTTMLMIRCVWSWG